MIILKKQTTEHKFLRTFFSRLQLKCRRYSKRYGSCEKMRFCEVFLPPLHTQKTLKNKIALIQGGTTGVGLQCVRELLKCQIKGIMISDEDERKGKELILNLCREFGSEKIAFIKSQPGDEPMLNNAFSETIKHYKGLDILINHAQHTSEIVWEKQVQRNINGIIRSSLLGLRYMGIHNNGSGGIIINVVSSAPALNPQDCPIFVGTKHFVIGFGRILSRKYYNQTNVKILTLCFEKNHDISLGRTIENNDDEDTRRGCDLSTVLFKGQNGTVWIG